MDSPPARQQDLLPWVQGLRALAAFSVAFIHFTNDAITNGTDPAGWLAAITKFIPWDAGVDIFFVISGFVIVHASAPLFATGASGLKAFMHRRLARIVPLYWIMTAAFLAVLAFGHGAIHGDIGGPAYLAASFLFIPWPRPDGLMQPAFGLGWTLNYEMFFYAVFTPFLLARRRVAVPAAIATLAAFVLFCQFHHPANPQLATWSNPIILEFCAGMALALLYARALAAGWHLNLAARLILLGAAILILHLGAGLSPVFRPLSVGVPACMLVTAAVFSPTKPSAGPHHRVLLQLGAASYAMYLVHPFIMRGFSIFWHKFHGQYELDGIIYVVAGLAVAQLCALMINGSLERKLNALLRRSSGSPNEIIQMPAMRADGLLREPAMPEMRPHIGLSATDNAAPGPETTG